MFTLKLNGGNPAMAEIKVTDRKSKRTGKTVYRIKKLGVKKCLWTDDPERIPELKLQIAKATW